MADSWQTDGKVISSLTVLHWQGKFEISLTVLWPTGKAKSIPDVSRLSGEIFPDGRLKTDVVYLSWQFLPLVNSKWRFSVRETRLSVTFFCWQLIPDGNHHRWPFLTVLVLFLTEETVRKKLSWGSGGRAATVVEDHVPFLVESELFLDQVRCRPVEKCSRDDHVSKVN